MTFLTTSPAAVLCLDAGQTGIKVRVERDGGAATERVFPGVRTHEPLLPQLYAVAQAVADDARVTFDVVSAGVSGLTAGEANAEVLLSMMSGLGAKAAHITHDSVTSFLGTLGETRGAVVAAGTGVVTLGVGSNHVARVDGWGNIMGDAGSGYWIGRQALDAAMRSYDGRGEPTALLEMLTRRWPDPESAYIALQADPLSVPIVASLAQQVSGLADTDPVAGAICDAAADELAHSVFTALRRVDEIELQPLVCAIGGVFSSPRIRARFDERLVQMVPSARLTTPRGDGLDGVATLRHLATEHPLRALVDSAAR